MDLSSFAARDEGAVLELVDPQGRSLVDEETGEPVWIRMLGADSAKATAIKHEVQNRRLKKSINFRRGKLNLTSQELEDETTNLLAACTAAWGNVVLDGEKIPCTFENAKKLYTRVPFVREQVDEFHNDRSEHLGNS